jgi:hypothetical protein
MTKKPEIKENAFDMGIAGTSGAVSTVPGFGTFSSPSNRQSPDSFVRSRTLGSHSNTANSATNSADFSGEIDQIYNKPVTPSPDEVITGMKYELQRMIKQDKGKAKEIVIQNLKKDPHYYGKLNMLNINDKEMMKQEPAKQDQMQERIKVLNQMIESKAKKAPTPTSYLDALKDTRDKKNDRYKK